MLDHLNLGAYYSFRLIKIQTRAFFANEKLFLSYYRMIIFNYPCCAELQQVRIIMLNLYYLGRKELCVLRELFVTLKMH